MTPADAPADATKPASFAKRDAGRFGAKYPRAAAILGAVVVFVVFGLLVRTELWRMDTCFTGRANTQIAEAQAWWQGRMDLPERMHDTALKDGRVYNIFPPMFTFIAATVVPFSDNVPHLFVVGVLVVPLVLLTYVLFVQRTGSIGWGVVLSLGFLLGTSVFGVIDQTIRRAPPYHVNHTIATIGLLLFLIDYLGRRRLWPAAIGLFLASLSRQLTFAYALPLLFMCFDSQSWANRWKRLALASVTVLAITGIYGGLNTAKFGHPLVTGYQLIHEGRDDAFAREAGEFGIISTHWIPRNLYYTNIGLPDLHHIETAGVERVFLRPNTTGTGIWWTSPILLWIFVGLPRLWKDRNATVLLGAAAILFCVLMLWYTTGAIQRGINRFSLDYIPVILALIAPHCVVGWRRWVSLVMIVWAVAYFRFILPIPHIEIW